MKNTVNNKIIGCLFLVFCANSLAQSSVLLVRERAHTIGYHGHAAGTTLSIWDPQGSVPVQGDYPLNSIRLSLLNLMLHFLSLSGKKKSGLCLNKKLTSINQASII